MRTLTPNLKRATKNSAGYDLSLAEDLVIPANGAEMGGTKTWVTMNKNDVALLFARSSLFKKYGVILANSVGVIDADYRDEIKVQFINMKNEEVVIPRNTRVAQLVFTNYFTTDIEEEPESERTGGHGSTGE